MELAKSQSSVCSSLYSFSAFHSIIENKSYVKVDGGVGQKLMLTPKTIFLFKKNKQTYILKVLQSQNGVDTSCLYFSLLAADLSVCS